MDSFVACGPLNNIPIRIINIIGTLITVIQISVPVLLIILGMVDFAKAALAQKEDEITKGQKMFISRLITGLMVFFVVFIVKSGVRFAATNIESNQIMSCIDCFINKKCEKVIVKSNNNQTNNNQTNNNQINNNQTNNNQINNNQINNNQTDKIEENLSQEEKENLVQQRVELVQNNLNFVLGNNSSTSSKNKKIKELKLNKKSDKIIMNSLNSNTINLKVEVSPSDAKYSISWKSSDTSVATVSNTGVVTVKGPGITKITATDTVTNIKATYELEVRKKIIIVITASQGKRMTDYFKTYTYNKNKYKLNDSLYYVYKLGAGFDFQTGSGTNQALDIMKKYKNKQEYVEFNVYYTLTGNSIKSIACSKITDSEVESIIKKYNSIIKSMKKDGYKVNGNIVSNNPLEANKPYTDSSFKIVLSSNSNACKAGYRSNLKYKKYNEIAEKIINNKYSQNLTYIPMFSSIIEIDNKNKEKWKTEFSTADGMHFNEATTKTYVKKVFDYTKRL